MGNPFRSIYRRARDTAYEIKPAKRTRHGFRFIGSTHRFDHCRDEIGTTNIISALAPELVRFVNAGANAGYFCLLAEGLGIPTIAFEPEANMFKRLRKNISLNTANCLAIPVALSNQRGTCLLYGTGTAGSLIPGLSGTPTWDKQIVSTITIDELLAKAAGRELWLMDCEGAEPLIIEGASNYIKENNPVLILEVEASRNKQRWEDTIAFLDSTGYKNGARCSDHNAELVHIQDILSSPGDNYLIWNQIHDQWIRKCLKELKQKCNPV